MGQTAKWRRRIAGSAAGIMLGLGASAGMADPLPGEQAFLFEASSGETVEAWRGVLSVPENRADPASREIELAYVRFVATDEAPVGAQPIVYLAGGPGGSGSGTARGPRFPLFMAMRQHGDVIAFDQRGTGESTALPRCVSQTYIPEDQVVSYARTVEAHRDAARFCRAFWEAQGIDLAGYTTAQSVADLSDLRQHLGADRLNLWGISYGSHLGLAAIDAMPEEIGRVILASVEGLDQTVKLPSGTVGYFERLQAAINSQPAARAAYPDVLGLMRRVQDLLEAEPMVLEVAQADGTVRPFLLQKHHVQQMTGALIADPQRAGLLLALYASLDAGDPSLSLAMLQRFVRLGEPISMSTMPTAMDVASGISPARLARFEAQLADSPVGPYLNFPMPQLAGLWPDMDLGDDFRAGPHGDVPVLVLTGTLDGRTYPESQMEAVAGLSDVTAVTVRHAGHNLFMTSPQVAEAMHRFMRGEDVGSLEIEVELPDLRAMPF
ncbi:alpha/beta fold hydrolase [Maricaulis sp. CAU 1757]